MLNLGPSYKGNLNVFTWNLHGWYESMHGHKRLSLRGTCACGTRTYWDMHSRYLIKVTLCILLDVTFAALLSMLFSCGEKSPRPPGPNNT